MDGLSPFREICRQAPGLRTIGRIVLSLLLSATLMTLAGGCRKFHRTDTTPLDNAGMSFDSIQSLRSLDIADAEVAELVKLKQAGLSDDTCVELVRVFHARKESLHNADAIGGLLQAGMTEDAILQLARLNQLGLWTGEAQAMRLAGLSDKIILEVAQRRAAGQPTFSGASLANFKNAGMSEATLLELVRRGVADNQAQTIIALRRRGWSDAQILRRYPPSAVSSN